MDVVSDKKVTRLVATEGKVRVYELEDGNWLTAADGTVAWRNNNPGNLKFEYQGSSDSTVHTGRSKEKALESAQSRYSGVVDLDQWGNAVFESYEAGREAQKGLLQGRGMQDKTVEELVKSYSTADYSGTTHHAAQVAVIYATAATQGVDLHSKTVAEMTGSELNALADGLSKAEGWKAGVVQQTAPLTEEELKQAVHAASIRAPASASHEMSGDHRNALRQGARGDQVGKLQTELNQLGYTDRAAHPLSEDGNFGPSTKAAVEAFQRDHGLKSDGIVGPATQKTLEEQTQTLAQANKSSYQWQCPVRLDDSAHPDNAFYLKTRSLVHQLDQQNGRAPDQRSDQLAAALTVSARASGLQRIDQIALSEDASALWGAQRPPGVRDHFFDQHCKVNTMQALNTPMEQSGAQWPQAMQQFQQHEEHAQQQQQVQQRDQAMQQQAAHGSQVTR